MGLGNLGDLGNLDLGQLQQLLPNVNFPASKDEVLSATLDSGQTLLFLFAMITVFLTAFYMFRAYFMAFWGEWRGGALHGEVLVQERISGLACSAAAVANGRSAVMLGVSEQLVGQRALGARGYAWCGNVVPPRLGAAQRHALAAAAQAVCAHLAAEFELRGLFGVDLMWGREQAWVLEVNPRPTGSLECIEAAHEVGVFAAHVASCAGRLPSIAPDPRPPRAAGKAILFATEDVRVGDTRTWSARGIRDVPHLGEQIQAGHPICTLISVQDSPHAVLADLEARAAGLRAELALSSGSDRDALAQRPRP